MEQEERIKEFESHFDIAKEKVFDFSKAIEEFKKTQKQVDIVDNYYGSEEWFIDKDAYELGNISKDIKAGILSEDEPYELLMENRRLALEMLEIATQILKKQ